jgi:hypothetical protein
MGLDQARAVAILAMLVAHFAPGVFAEVPRLAPLRAPALAFARVATPAFMVVFGVAVGFVLVPRWVREGPADAARHLRRRAALMFGCAVLVTVPLWARLATAGGADPWAWAFGLYSMLLFYALALALLPAWLRWLAPRPGRRAVLAGAGLWAAGTALHRAWPQGPASAEEFARMVLVSGSFAYLQMMGTALLAVPVGLRLRAGWEVGADRRLLGRLLAGSLALAAAGGLWGWAAGEYDPGRLLAGDLRTPPRAWYFLHVGGVGLALVPALELASRALRPLRPAAYLLALFGQAGLVIYTGHSFVLPALAAADRLVPLHGAARAAAALVPFAAFCGLVMYARHRQAAQRGRATDRRGAGSPLAQAPGDIRTAAGAET